MPALAPGLRARLGTIADSYQKTAAGRRRSVRLPIGAKLVRLEVVTLERRGPRAETKPHLRFDRGALALMAQLRARLSRAVPVGTTLLVSVTAPIWQDSKTAVALEGRARALLAAPARAAGVRASVFGNGVRLRLGPGPSRLAPLIAFVHNRETDPRVLFDMTRDFLGLLVADSRPGGRRRPTAHHWLLVLTAEAPSQLAAYRAIAAQCRGQAASRILMRFRNGQIEALG